MDRLYKNSSAWWYVLNLFIGLTTLLYRTHENPIDFAKMKCYLWGMKFLKTADSEIYNLIKLEEKRQAETLMMIASENVVSKAVEEAVGSCLGNKYAEGYPGRRYYQGQKYVDQIETLVQDRVKKLFGVPAANVQPLSGSPMNFAVYTALLKPGDKIMGLSLVFGGHLTHGAHLNASSIYFTAINYELGKDGLLDYNAIRTQAKKEKPQIIVAGFTAYPRIIDWKAFRKIADEVGAYLMTDISHIAGLVAAGVYPSPVPYAHIVTTTTHKTLRGARGGIIMTTDEGFKKDPEMSKKINRAIIPGIQGGPHLNAIAGIGVALKEDAKPAFKKYAQQIVANAQALAKELMSYDFKLISGGTDSHLILIDLRNFKILGNTMAEACEAAGIVLNGNGVPFDTNSPFYPSGLRLGTPGITSRGMKEKEMKFIARWLRTIVEETAKTKQKLGNGDEKKREVRKQILDNTKILSTINREVKSLCKKFPIKKEY